MLFAMLHRGSVLCRLLLQVLSNREGDSQQRSGLIDSCAMRHVADGCVLHRWGGVWCL